MDLSDEIVMELSRGGVCPTAETRGGHSITTLITRSRSNLRINLVPRVSPLHVPGSSLGREEERPWKRGCGRMSVFQIDPKGVR